MSWEYPCIYFEKDGVCRKFSDDTAISYCGIFEKTPAASRRGHLMDIEKLIEQLRWWADNCDRTNYGCQARPFLLDAATALSTLQDENEQLHRRLSEATSVCSRIAEWAQNTGHDYVEGVAKEFLEGTNDGL